MRDMPKIFSSRIGSLPDLGQILLEPARATKTLAALDTQAAGAFSKGPPIAKKYMHELDIRLAGVHDCANRGFVRKNPARKMR
jgi:hypothetical protein